MCETHTIKAYSGPTNDCPSIWADHWICPICTKIIRPGIFGSGSTACPLHNPMNCAGKIVGVPHPSMPCRPVGEVFNLDIQTRTRTIIGRVA